MPHERRDLISDLYHRALARAPEERAWFLIEACNGDEGLREEVESLLEFEPASAHLLERPAVAVAAVATGSTSMIDRRIGPYTIVAPLGAGGMGEVASLLSGTGRAWLNTSASFTVPPRLLPRRRWRPETVAAGRNRPRPRGARVRSRATRTHEQSCSADPLRPVVPWPFRDR